MGIIPTGKVERGALTVLFLIRIRKRFNLRDKKMKKITMELILKRMMLEIERMRMRSLERDKKRVGKR